MYEFFYAHGYREFPWVHRCSLWVISDEKSRLFEQLLQFPQQLLLDYVHLAAHVSNGLKPRIRPVVGRIQPKARVSIVRWNLKEAGCEEHTNSRANLWSDGQKSYMRLCMRVRLHIKSKHNNYTESCMINEADGWRGRNVWYLGRSVRYALKEVTIA